MVVFPLPTQANKCVRCVGIFHFNNDFETAPLIQIQFCGKINTCAIASYINFRTIQLTAGVSGWEEGSLGKLGLLRDINDM